MLTIFEYLGISIFFHSHEHDLIHVHARYQGSTVKVPFFLKDSKIYRTIYKTETGKIQLAKLKSLKIFISKYNLELLKLWNDYVVLKKRPKVEKITKNIRHGN
jgi:hypothetical protein